VYNYYYGANTQSNTPDNGYIEKPKHVVCLINKLDKPIQGDVIVLCLIEYYPHNNAWNSFQD
jgi:hypothetical protein